MSIVTLERSNTEVAHRRDYERYIENARFEEKTDIGERLGYHIATTLNYEMHEGVAYCATDTKDRPFHEQTRAAMEAGKWKFTGVNAFEAERLRLEHEEALLVDAFGRGELSGNVLVKFSKVPDAVVSGTASINGYRRDLMRSFVRIYYKTNHDSLSSVIFSLDGNNLNGFRNIENLIKMRIADRGSEESLGDHTLFDWSSDDLKAQIEMLVEEIKLRYDKAVYDDTGRKTYAGSEFTDRSNALQVIDKHPDLFEEHWRAVAEVQGRALSNGVREEYLEEMRRKTAAAIKLREGGLKVDSVGDTNVAHEAETGEYGRECATNGMNQSENALESGKEITMTCPFCGLPTIGDPCAVVLECTECRAKVVNGVVVSEGIGRTAALATRLNQTERLEGQLQNPPMEKVDLIRKVVSDRVKRLFGGRAILKSQVAVGYARINVVDEITGEVLQADVKQEDFVLAA